MTLMSRGSCNGGMLWRSAPTCLNNDLLIGGVILAKYSETINLAFKGSLILAFRKGTRRACFLRSTRAWLKRMPECVWALEREMKGWEFGGRHDCLRMKTMDRTLKLLFAETLAIDKTAAEFRAQKRIGDHRPLLRRSKGKEEEKQITLLKKAEAHKSSSWSKGWKGNPLWQSATTTSDCQSSPEQWAKEDKRSRGAKRRHRFFNEARVIDKERKTSWQKSLEESQRREDEPVQQTAELPQPEWTRERRPDYKTASTPGPVVAMKRNCPWSKTVQQKKNSGSALKAPIHLGSQRRERQKLWQKHGSCH